MKTLEQAFVDVEQAVSPLAKAIDSAAVSAKQLLTATHSGDVGQVRRALDKLANTVELLQQAVTRIRAAWIGSDSEEERYLGGAYEDELVGVLTRAGLPSFRRGSDLMAFPFVLRVMARERALRVNNRKVSVLRPSAVVTLLERSRRPRFTNERFVEALFGAYRTIVGDESGSRPVTLRRVYETLMLFPTIEAEYSEAQFARDIYSVDRNGPRQTQSGAELHLVGSTGTKSKKDAYFFVGPDGELVEYYGLQFMERKE